MELQKFLPYQLSVLSNKISTGIAKYYREQYGISIAEWRVLVILSNLSKQTAKELILHSQMDKVKVSRTMKVLEDKSLITEKVCKQDARAKRYNLTKAGIELIKAVEPKANAFEKQLIESLSKQELSAFKQVLGTLNQQVDKITEQN